MKLSCSFILIVCIMFLVISCHKTDELVDFTVDEERLLGEKLAEVISTSQDYSVIPPEKSPSSYNYVNSLLNEIVTSSALIKSENFKWTITLLNNKEGTAFATPGGGIYINTGLIFLLANEDQLSGLIAHLVAHIDKSHVTERLFFKFGINNFKSITNGNDNAALLNVLNALNPSIEPFSYTIANELEADRHTVLLLAESDQSCAAVGLFIQQIQKLPATKHSMYSEIHSKTSKRGEDINVIARMEDCNVEVDSESSLRFKSFRNSLP